MKQIIKISEPISLIQHRATKFASFDNLPLRTKEELRQNLLLEQGHICCYCMKRIPEKVEKDNRISYDMKVEHYQCQDNFPLLQLKYTNLLGACTGNEGKPERLQTCDTYKKNQTLTINLLANIPSCETLFKYNADGEISSVSDDIEVNRQLNDILNLNMSTLKDGRSEIYLEVQERVDLERRKTKNNKAAFLKFLMQERARWIDRTDNKNRPYCSVAIYYLTKKIKINQN